MQTSQLLEWPSQEAVTGGLPLAETRFETLLTIAAVSMAPKLGTKSDENWPSFALSASGVQYDPVRQAVISWRPGSGKLRSNMGLTDGDVKTKNTIATANVGGSER